MKQLAIKYCGNKSLEDLQIVAESNASYIGFIFAPSQRQVDPLRVKEWVKKISLHNKKVVGVFVNAEITEIESVISMVPLSIIQCHGTENVEYLKRLKEKTNLEVWKVIHHEDNAVRKMKQFEGIAEGFIIDTKVNDKWGGSGVSFDWRNIPIYMKESRRQGVPCYIAGGINATNIRKLLNFDIDGFDISSGIETNGKKDNELIQSIEKWVDNHE